MSTDISKAAEALYEIFEKIDENHDESISAIEKLVILEKKGVLNEVVKLSELKIPFTVDEVKQIAPKLNLLFEFLVNIDERTIKVVKRFLEAFEESMVYEPMGLAESAKALRDPDVQKAIGFALTLAKNFGKRI